MKSIRLSFVFLLIFLAATMIAAAGNRSTSLTFENKRKKSLISDRLTGIFFRENIDSLEIIGVGKAKKISGVEVKSAEINGSMISLLKIPLNNNNYIIETAANGSSVIKVGKHESINHLKKKTKVYLSRVTMVKRPGLIRFSFTKQPRSVRFFLLQSPGRVVFDFVGIKGTMRNIPKNVRVANHSSKFRVVVDNNIPQYFSLVRDKTYTFRVAGRKPFAAFTKEMSENKTQKQTVSVSESVGKTVKKTEKKQKKTKITGLAFVGENPEILKIKAAGSINIKKTVTGKKVDITVVNAFIAKNKEQIVDVSSLNGPVSEIAVYNQNGNVKILAKMKSLNFAFNVVSMKSGVEFVFALKNKKAKVRTKVRRTTKAAAARREQQLKRGVIKIDEKEKKYTGKKINLDFKEVDILDMLRLMSDISKLNIIAGDDVKGRVTVRLVDIPWDEALDVILKSKSLGKERFGNIIRVATLRTMQIEKEEELSKKKAQKNLEPIKVRLIAVNYALANKLTSQVKELLTDRGSVSVDERTNVLIIKDIKETLDKAEQLIEYLDTQTPQVLIEARIVEATSTAAEGLGIKWETTHTYSAGSGHPTGIVFPYNMGVGGSVSVPGPGDPTGTTSFSLGSMGMINNLNLTLNIMEAEGKIKIISSPKVATLDNTEAMIQQGVSIPITTRSATGPATTKYLDATLVLRATPHITADGSILMNLNINKSEPDWSNTNYLNEPSIIKKEAKTHILIKSGDTVVIGGVYTNKTSKNTRNVPILSKIPILGWLFKSEVSRVERSELLIFLTPKIMNQVKSSMPSLTSESE